MIHYEDIKRIESGTKVIVLSNPENTERFLFYNNPWNKSHNPIIQRQKLINGRWKWMQNLEGEETAIQRGGINTTKEKGNRKYLEIQDKGFSVKTVTNLFDI